MPAQVVIESGKAKDEPRSLVTARHSQTSSPATKARKNSEVLYETNTRCVVGRTFLAIVWPATIVLFQELPSDTSYDVHVGSERQAAKYHLSTFANSAGLRAGCALGFVAFDDAVLSILGANGC